jgi:formylmethanofuran dehydrogenase subunit E
MSNFAFQVSGGAFQGAGQFAFQGTSGTPVIIVDTHDGVKKRIKQEIDYYRQNKEALRNALNVAIYGEDVEIQEVQAVADEIVAKMPYALTASEIAQIAAEVNAKVQQSIAIRNKRIEDDNDDDEAAAFLLLH